MRQITEQSIAMFLSDGFGPHIPGSTRRQPREWRFGNMHVIFGTRADNAEVITMYLHGNKIAQRIVGEPSLYICAGGWQTNTTKERLNGLPGVSISQRDFKWYLNGQPWNGAWATIALT